MFSTFQLTFNCHTFLPQFTLFCIVFPLQSTETILVYNQNINDKTTIKKSETNAAETSETPVREAVDKMTLINCDTAQHPFEEANDIRQECNKHFLEKNSKMEIGSIEISDDSHQGNLSLDHHHQHPHQHHLSHNSDTDSALSSAPPSISPQPPGSGVEPSSIWQTVSLLPPTKYFVR